MPEQKSSCPNRKRYKTDLTDAQWELVRPLLPPAVAKTGWEPTNLREILNTLLYQNHTSCQWDMLPHDLCAKSTTYDYYKAWQDNGVWELIVDTLRGKIRVATPRVETKPKETPPADSNMDSTSGGEINAEPAVPV